MLLRSMTCYFVVSVLICGCRGDDGPVLVGATGSVTLEGKPVAGATITMKSEKGLMSNGFTDSEGKFKMTTGGRPGVPVGKALVGITKFSETKPEAASGTLKGEDMMKMQMAGGGKAKDLTPKSELPPKYADPEKSGITATIESDASQNVFEFPLVGK